MANLELLPTNGMKEDVSPESSPSHSPAQTNGLTQEPFPEEPKYVQHDTFFFYEATCLEIPFLFFYKANSVSISESKVVIVKSHIVIDMTF